jgi:hypothetical protein
VKVLFLDDMHIRHDTAKRWFEGHELVHVYTAPDAIAKLKETKFDLVCLDHDLAEEHYLTLSEGVSQEPFCNTCKHEKSLHYKFNELGVRGLCSSCDCKDYQSDAPEYAPGTGMDVADFIARMPTTELARNEPGMVIVHSWNPTRSVQMHERMRNAGIRSFKVQFNPSNCPVKVDRSF